MRGVKPAKRRRRRRQQYQNISFQFLSAGGEEDYEQGTVLMREHEMVIDIQGEYPYLVRGRKVEHYFAGIDSINREIDVDVKARWALLGDIYVGIWIEDGVEFLFSFRLPHSHE